METTYYNVVMITGLTWKQAILAVTDPLGDFAPGFANTEEIDWEAKTKTLGLDPSQVILIATHPIAGTGRWWQYEEGSDPEIIPDGHGDAIHGWWVATQDNFVAGEWVSGSSGTVTTIEKDDDGYTVSVRTKIDDNGKPVNSLYMEALNQITGQEV